MVPRELLVKGKVVYVNGMGFVTFIELAPNGLDAVVDSRESTFPVPVESIRMARERVEGFLITLTFMSLVLVLVETLK